MSRKQHANVSVMMVLHIDKHLCSFIQIENMLIARGEFNFSSQTTASAGGVVEPLVEDFFLSCFSKTSTVGRCRRGGGSVPICALLRCGVLQIFVVLWVKTEIDLCMGRTESMCVTRMNRDEIEYREKSTIVVVLVSHLPFFKRNNFICHEWHRRGGRRKWFN